MAKIKGMSNPHHGPEFTNAELYFVVIFWAIILTGIIFLLYMFLRWIL